MLIELSPTTLIVLERHSYPNNCDTKPALVDDIKILQISDDVACEKEEIWRKRQAVKNALPGHLTGKTLW